MLRRNAAASATLARLTVGVTSRIHVSISLLGALIWSSSIAWGIEDWFVADKEGGSLGVALRAALLCAFSFVFG
jgi:hypothetical protein